MRATSASTAAQRFSLAASAYRRGEQKEQEFGLLSELDGIIAAQNAFSDFLDGKQSDTLMIAVKELSRDARAMLGEHVQAPLVRQYERHLTNNVRTAAKSAAFSAPYERAERILGKTSTIYAQYEDFVNMLDYSPLTHALQSVTRRALLEHMDDIDQSVLRDLRELRHHTVTRDMMLALCLHYEWQSSVARATYRVVEDRVLNGLRSSPSIDPDESLSDEPVDFEQSILATLHAWLQHAIVPVLIAWRVPHVDALVQQAHYQLHLALGRLRARQLFDIISDFPQSSPALQDLISCSEQIDVRTYVSDHLAMALKARLLHPGASTRDIIQFYTHLIRSLRFVDPSGVILSHVIRPVRSYLRARSDTIPVIVASLLGQAGEFTLLRDMMRETADTSHLSRLGGAAGGNGIASSSAAAAGAAADQSLTIYDEGTTSNAGAGGSGDVGALQVDIAAMDESRRMVFIPEPEEDWAPRPVDAGPDYRQSRKSDVIAIIVSIFDDEEGFIAALERSCAEQIIQVRAYDTAKEYETKENLKKRFGDASMSRCDVMLNDVRRSQRIDRRVHRLLDGERIGFDVNAVLRTLHPLVLSRQFWPLLKDDEPAANTAVVAGQTATSTAHGADTSSSNGAAGSLMFASMPSATVGSTTAFPLPASTTLLQGAASTSIGRANANDVADDVQEMPAHYVRAMETYQELFLKVVHGRKLRWLPGRSAVDVCVEMNDGRVVNERVSPLQACVIEMAAASHSSSIGAVLHVDSLAEQLAVSRAAVRNAMLFWTSRGLLAEEDEDSFAVVEGSQ